MCGYHMQQEVKRNTIVSSLQTLKLNHIVAERTNICHITYKNSSRVIPIVVSKVGEGGDMPKYAKKPK